MTATTTLADRITATAKQMRIGSPEFKALLAAVKAGKPYANLVPLAGAAALTLNQLSDIRNGVGRLAELHKAVDALPARERDWAKLNAEAKTLQAQLGKATCDDDRRAIADKLEGVRTQMNRLQPDYIESTQAVNFLAGLKADGIE